LASAQLDVYPVREHWVAVSTVTSECRLYNPRPDVFYDAAILYRFHYMTAPLLLDDVHRCVSIVSKALAPRADLDPVSRKRELAEAVLNLVGADVYVWNSCVAGDDGDIMATSFLEGGWRNEEQRTRVVEILIQPKVGAATMSVIGKCIGEQKPNVFRLKTILMPELFSRVSSHWEPIEFVDLLLHVYPLSPTSFSAIGIYRFGDRKPFLQRESDLIALVMNHVDWLHRHGENKQVGVETLDLSPRQRHVLVGLISGDSVADIAANLSLSIHTVGDYVKAIYKHFDVNTRAELHALFHLGRRKHP